MDWELGCVESVHYTLYSLLTAVECNVQHNTLRRRQYSRCALYASSSLLFSYFNLVNDTHSSFVLLILYFHQRNSLFSKWEIVRIHSIWKLMGMWTYHLVLTNNFYPLNNLANSIAVADFQCTRVFRYRTPNRTHSMVHFPEIFHNLKRKKMKSNHLKCDLCCRYGHAKGSCVHSLILYGNKLNLFVRQFDQTILNFYKNGQIYSKITSLLHSRRRNPLKLNKKSVAEKCSLKINKIIYLFAKQWAFDLADIELNVVWRHFFSPFISSSNDVCCMGLWIERVVPGL